MIKEKEIETFEKALGLLDMKLVSINKKITVYAIGGFAMLYLGVKEHGFTIDIDTLTEKYDDDVLNAIKEVGIEMELDDEWLNNDCASLDGFMSELKNEINWEKSKYRFKNIDLYVADYLGLIRAKSKAVHDGGLVPRKTDKKDLLLLLKLQSINNIKDVDKRNDVSFIKLNYPRTYDYLKEKEEW